MPQGFKDYIANNAERIKVAEKKGTLPYFIKDNPQYVEKVTGTKIESREGMFGRGKGRNKEKSNYVENELPDVSEIKPIKDTQRDNIEAFLKKLGYSDKAIGSIIPMSFNEADQGKANKANDIYNCQTCAPVFLARLRGINISAISYKDGGFMERLANDMRLAFKGSDKLQPISYTCKKAREVEVKKALLVNDIKRIPNNTIYHLGFDLKINKEEGHIYTILKQDNKLFVLDNQERKGENWLLDDIIPRYDFTKKVQLMRVDNLDFSDEFMYFSAKYLHGK